MFIIRRSATRTYLLVRRSTLGLVLGNGCTCASDLLALVLGLLHSLARTFDLLGQSLTHHSVFWLKLHHGILIVVN